MRLVKSAKSESTREKLKANMSSTLMRLFLAVYFATAISGVVVISLLGTFLKTFEVHASPSIKELLFNLSPKKFNFLKSRFFGAKIQIEQKSDF